MANIFQRITNELSDLQLTLKTENNKLICIVRELSEVGLEVGTHIDLNESDFDILQFFILPAIDTIKMNKRNNF